MKNLLILSLAFLFVVDASADPLLNRSASPMNLALEAESGIIKVFSHSLQIGASGTDFDYVNQGGQEILFPFSRFTATLSLGHHGLSFLYQPLELNTRVRTRELVVQDGQSFPAGSDLLLKYSFPFWRATYSYTFDFGALNLGVGAALQLRNASIVFSLPSGASVSVSQNLGPVPALFLSADWRINDDFAFYAEATGLYASSAIINGASFQFEGSILDFSLRPKLYLREGLEAFLNLRFLGGSAEGVSAYDSTQWSVSTERFTANYLATGSLTLGFTLR